MSSNLEIEKICEECGEEFIARKLTTRFCSHRCSSRAYKARKRAEQIDEATRLDDDSINHNRTGKTYSTTKISYQRMSEIERLCDWYDTVKDKEFLSVADTAILLSVSRSTVYRYLHGGDL